MNARKLQSKLSMQIQDTVRASEMVLNSVADNNILRTERKRITKYKEGSQESQESRVYENLPSA